MDMNKPYTKLDKEVDADFILQDGKIYGWSESNIQYEHVWWLTNKGDPINDTSIVKTLMKERPFDKKWLQ